MINLLFAGNSKVFDGILTCMLSILKRSNVDNKYKVYVMTMDLTNVKDQYTPISEEQINILSQVLKKYNIDNEVIKLDVTDIYMKEFYNCKNQDAYCSPYTLIRLFIDLIDNMEDKLLYLDIDIMFNRSINLLYDINIDNYEYAASRDHYGKYLLYPNYINAGVILFNLKECKKNNLFVKARELIRKKKLVFADQSALIRSTTKKKVLPQRFNDQKFLHKHTVVRHFSKRLFYLPYPHTDNIKQWHIDKVRKVFKYHQFDDIYQEYLEIKSTMKE